MRDLYGRPMYRFQVGIRLADGSYSAPCRFARSPKHARTDVIKSLRASGHTGWTIESTKQVPL
jgi:hypothetical protein